MTGGPYDDIINLPHHVSTKYPQMSMEKRAAQFSPFAALSGYGAAIKETERRTEKRRELDENAIAELDMKLRALLEHLSERPVARITYFQPDEKKEGGTYVTAEGAVKKIDIYAGTITLVDETRIAVEDITEIECELFKRMW